MEREPTPPSGRYLGLLSLTALGVVYGDIGTSPLYALRECFHGPHAIAATPANVLGVLSLIFWSLAFVISFKYLAVVLRADNRGEGGILALMALIQRGRVSRGTRSRWLVPMLGLFGAALLYGDGAITPAISVLSAVEGLQVATPVFEPYVLPLTVVLLIALFLIQQRGTARVGAVFGPVMVVWFFVLGVLGLVHISSAPGVLLAISPTHAADFFARNRLGIRGAGKRLPRRNRGESALRRHGTLWPAPDPTGLVRVRSAGAAPELLRPRRPVAGARRKRR